MSHFLRVAVAIMLATAVPFPQPVVAQSSATLRIPFPQEDGTLTPYTFTFGYPLMTLVYDTLMWRDQSGTPRPWLARDVKVTNGGRRVTVELRNGARWHDGRRLTAGDVEFTFEYVRARYHPRFTPQLELIDEVRAVKPSRVVFELTAPGAGFLDQPLSDVPILPRHLWEGIAAGDVPPGSPVGSGPYRMTRHRPDNAYTFRANRNYFLGAPRVRTLKFPIVPGPEDMLERLETREVDMVPLTLPRDAAQRLEDLGAEVATGAYYVGTILVFNVRRAPFDDPVVRRAVAAALDLRTIARAAGNGVPAEYGLIHPRSPWASDEILHRVDPSAARDALTRVDVPRVEVLAPAGDPVRAEAGRRVAIALDSAGVSARVKTIARDDLVAALGEDSAPARFTLAIWSTPPLASYDPAFVARMLASDPRTAPLNVSGYESARFDRVARRVATAADDVERRAAVEEQLRLIARDAPVVPLLFQQGAFAYNPRSYDDWVFIEGTGILDKQSFIDHASSTFDETPERARGVPRVQPERELPPLMTASLVLFAIFVVAFTTTAVRARRGR
jgi:peptide/nickel transport system substrate-binding protein